MIDTFTTQPAAAWLALRLQEKRDELAARWRESVPGRDLRVPDLVTIIADHLSPSPAIDVAGDPRVQARADEIGELRFAQGSSIPELLRDYQVLAEILEAFVLAEVESDELLVSPGQAVDAAHRIARAVRVLQQRSVTAFARRYTDTIERQRHQLIAFGRLVGHEMRQPLGVLQLMSGVIPVREGDHAITRLLDLLDRNVRRLAAVAGRLERLSHDALDDPALLLEQRADVGEVAARVLEKLRGLAQAHEVHVQIDSTLPTLRIDATRVEMVLETLIANAIRYSDPRKRSRLVEVLRMPHESQPTIVVRDNGIGMSPRRVQHFFREFSRAHDHRELRGGEQGLGLGLSIVRSTMDACGGTVLLQSTEGVGTTVTLSWPKRASASS